jgi:hypothetical protein
MGKTVQARAEANKDARTGEGGSIGPTRCLWPVKPVHALIVPHGTVSDPLSIHTAVETSKAVSLPVTNPAEDWCCQVTAQPGVSVRALQWPRSTQGQAQPVHMCHVIPTSLLSLDATASRLCADPLATRWSATLCCFALQLCVLALLARSLLMEPSPAAAPTHQQEASAQDCATQVLPAEQLVRGRGGGVYHHKGKGPSEVDYPLKRRGEPPGGAGTLPERGGAQAGQGCKTRNVQR